MNNNTNTATKKEFDEYVTIIRRALETGDYRIIDCGLYNNNDPKK